jgi:phenylphosphate carboxylase alpha subunit
MVPGDLREFIKALEKTQDIVHMKEEVDWDLEAGAISRLVSESSGPAILFEKIKDYGDGYRILGGPLATWRRVAIAMGLLPQTSVREIHRVYEERVDQPIKPVLVESAPCKQHILLHENEIDLYRLPAPLCHEGDGGRYIGTWDLIVSKDPDSDWMNWGMYRFMIQSRRYLVGAAAPFSHLGTILKKKYLPTRRSMPVAVVIGADPLCSLAAATGYRVGENEVDFAGGLRRGPVDVIKCETTDLLVPANAEIVIEGEILPDRTAPEGPFGEYPGYRHEETQLGVLMRVTAITHRDSPILTMSNLGVPPDDSSVAGAMGVTVALKRRLLRHDIPTTGVFLPPDGASHLVVVGVKSGGMDMAKRIRDLLTGQRAWYTKIIVVDEDVDVFDMGQVMHAFSVKCHSTRGISLLEVEGKGNQLTPCYSRDEREKRMAAIGLFDCTWPPGWPRRDIPTKMSFEEAYSHEVKKTAIAKLRRYGWDWKNLGDGKEEAGHHD